MYLFFSGYKAPHCDTRKKQIHNLPEHAFINEITLLRGTPVEVIKNKEFRNWTPHILC